MGNVAFGFQALDVLASVSIAAVACCGHSQTMLRWPSAVM